jgi:quinol monooxygenase YgiN
MAKRDIGTRNDGNARGIKNDVCRLALFVVRKGYSAKSGQTTRGITIMAKYALYVPLTAKPGKAAEVEAFLKQGAEMAKAETGTATWYGIKEGPDSYAVFDTFNDDAGRDSHLNGAIAKALMAKADELFSNKLEIHKIDIIADK